MLFVQHPQDFQEVLPGFLPRNLSPAASGSDSFGELLRKALFPSGGAPLMSGDHPQGDPKGFWTRWYLAAQAPDSQYDILRSVIADHQDLPGHLVCLALSGKGFHGQQARSWEAVSGNLHLSVALRCDLPAVDFGPVLPMLPAVAVVDAVKALTAPENPPAGLGIKWVNDILIAGRKIGGVLTSARSQDGRIGSVVLGIGLNVGTAPKVPPTIFTPGVTCLKDHLTLPSAGLGAVLGSVLQALAHRFEELTGQGPGPLLDGYRSASLILGRKVEVWSDGPSSVPMREGRVLDIGPDLSLSLTGGPEPVTSGRLVFLPESF